MKLTMRTLLPGLLLQLVFLPSFSQSKITVWLTKGDSSVLFKKQTKSLSFSPKIFKSPSIDIDDSNTYQSIDGFGFALTQGSAMPMIKMGAPERAALLKELFDTAGSSIGVSYIRLTIGASDLNERIFSYDDLAEGQTDTALAHFDLGPDHADVIPVTKQILAINPTIKIMGSPWSPPVWMKNNHDTRGGRLLPAYYHVYANYLAKYIMAMKNEGIRIDAITIQNEPLHPGNNPSMLMTAPEQTEFIKHHLGPLFKTLHIDTKIIVYDHNADRPDYPIYILNDKEARQYVDGSAFHLYNGETSAFTDVHNAHPDKNIYFTEQMTVQFGRDENVKSPKINIAWPVSWLLIGSTRNWSKNVLEWNLAGNSQFTPFTDRGGCDVCQGAVSVDGNKVTRNLGYYSMAHFSKFVRPGSVRIGSTETTAVSNVAFKTASGRIILIVSNTSEQIQQFNIRYKNKSVEYSLPAGSAATFYWD